MKRLIMTLIFIFTTSCVEADLQGAVDEVVDALGNSDCSTSAKWAIQYKKDGKDDKEDKKDDKDDKNDTDDSDDSNSDDSTADNDNNQGNDDAEDDTTADNSTNDDEDSDETTASNDDEPCDSGSDDTASNDDSDSYDTSGDTQDNGGYDYSDTTDDEVSITTQVDVQKSGEVFVGTFSLNTGPNCNNRNGYDFPATMRVFSYGEYLDFITADGRIAFTARTFPDDTFDFVATFANAFGQKTVLTSCTCGVMDNPYYHRAFDCACEPSNNDDACEVYYQEM